MSIWNHLPLEHLAIRNEAWAGRECAACNVFDLQAIGMVAKLDREIKQLWDDGYTVDADRLLDKRRELVEWIRSGPHS